MKKSWFSLLFLLVLLPVSAFAAGTCGSADDGAGSTHCTGSSPWTADSASYADVNHCVNTCAEACVGDSCPTVIVPAESATWATKLTITKGMTLNGTGATITGAAYGGHYGPINISLAADEPLRITGFTILGNSASYSGIYLESSGSPAIKTTKVRIDHNTISGGTDAGIYLNSAYIFGVADNNTITGNHTFDFSGAGSTEWAGENATRAFGTVNNFYVEDNTLNFKTFVATNGSGGRYAFRYNTISKYEAGYYAIWDAHGNQGVIYTNLATMLTELYGNSIDLNSAAGGKFFDHRGGWLLAFYNLPTEAPAGESIYYYTREEYADDYKGSSYVMKPTNSYYWGNLKNGSTHVAQYTGDNENCCVNTVDWQSSHSYGSYYCAKFNGDANKNCWRTIDNWTPPTSGPSGTEEPNWAGSPNKLDVIIDGSVTWLNMGAGTPIAENTDWFAQKTGTFDGTGVTGGGVGCGTLAARPATCTTGVGYWVTTQSCTDLTGLVGVNATPISGSLHKCTATNTWTADYYVPYTYPHPLRNEAPAENDVTAPTVTAFTIPATATSLTVTISSFTAQDAYGVTGYCVNETASAPTAGSCSGSGWAGSAQTTYTASIGGAKTLYAWAKDAAGNISTSLSGTVLIHGTIGLGAGGGTIGIGAGGGTIGLQ